MTWRKSFFKITMQDIKKRIWCMALFFVVQFFAFPIKALLAVQSYSSPVDSELHPWDMAHIGRIFEQGIFDIGSTIALILLIAGALVLAMSGFSYLNSKKKVDFIHSMPIKREMLFLSRYITGFFLYMLPLVLNVGICLIVSVTSNVCSIYILESALWFLLYQAIYFLLFYSTAILAIVLIGNFVASFLGIFILYSYQTMFWAIIVNFKVNFFSTYMGNVQEFRAYDPIGLFARQILSLNTGYLAYDKEGMLVRVAEESYYSTGREVGLMALLLAIIIGGLALLLFRIRKSEAAGKTLVFPKLEPFAKVALAVPAGLIGGQTLYGIAASYQKVWYVFGAAVVFLLFAAVVEIIFRQDFKGFLKHKISMLAGAGIVLVITLCFWLDALGYDSRIPKADRIESVGVSIPQIEIQQAEPERTDGFYSAELSSDSAQFFSNWIRQYVQITVNYNLDRCKITDKEAIEKVRTLAGHFVEQKGEYKKLERELSLETLSDMEQYVECQVVYRLKNGETIYRAYRMPYGEDCLAVVEPVFADKTYREVTMPIFQDDVNYSYLYTLGTFAEKTTRIARSHKKELLECYQKDREHLTFQTVWEQPASGYFCMQTTLGSQSAICNVYEGDTNTRDWLEEHEISFTVQPEDLEVHSCVINYTAEDGRYCEFELDEEQEKEEMIPCFTRYEFLSPAMQFTGNLQYAMVEYKVRQGKDSAINESNYILDDADEEDMQQDVFYIKDMPPFIQEKLR